MSQEKHVCMCKILTHFLFRKFITEIIEKSEVYDRN